MHKHHIVFRSQGGLNFYLNYKFLTCEEHEGNKGPHKNREKDLEYKLELQEELQNMFVTGQQYTVKDIAKRIGTTERYLEKHFKRVRNYYGKYRGEDIVRKLMGGKLYDRS